MVKCKKGFRRMGGKCKRSMSVAETVTPKRFPKLIIYIMSLFLLVTGVGLLFWFGPTMEIIHKIPIIFSLLVIFAGYVTIVGARRR